MSARPAGRTALVTGAASGIGAAAALRFAAEGAAVAVLDIRAEAAAEVVARIGKCDGLALPLVADVTDAEQVDDAVGRTVTEFGRLDILYNNAGVDTRGSVADADEADWERVLAVSAKGTFLCSRAAAPHLTASGASIINQASVAGLVGVRNLAAYCAAKGAVIALTRAMAVDLAPTGIRVNVICPGTIATPLIEPLLIARGTATVNWAWPAPSRSILSAAWARQRRSRPSRCFWRARSRVSLPARLLPQMVA